MVIFNNWQISETGGVLAYQYDNKTRVLLVAGDLPEGWTWDILVSVGDKLDIIRLSQMEGGVGVVLTADMLALTGYYVMQLRGMRDELVRHTNQMTVFIPPSLSGDANWPEIPSEFTQMEERINDAASHYPQIGEDDTWLTYDVESGEWTDTGVSAVGPKGEKGGKGDKGEDGVSLPASGCFTLSGDEDGNLWCNYVDGEYAPQFDVTNDGDIYYVIPE